MYVHDPQMHLLCLNARFDFRETLYRDSSVPATEDPLPLPARTPRKSRAAASAPDAVCWARPIRQRSGGTLVPTSDRPRRPAAAWILLISGDPGSRRLRRWSRARRRARRLRHGHAGLVPRGLPVQRLPDPGPDPAARPRRAAARRGGRPVAAPPLGVVRLVRGRLRSHDLDPRRDHDDPLRRAPCDRVRSTAG